MPTFPEFPLPIQTGQSKQTSFPLYEPKLVEGQIEIQRAKDTIDSHQGQYSARLFTTDLEVIEQFLEAKQGYAPFTWQGQNFICVSYTISYTGDNRGIISMSLVEYTNPI
ncbi:MAG: phage tail protein [Scytonema sp. CRU_2_7]|nr:phage tail protein [Scytonema sp. CRU_2_7]